MNISATYRTCAAHLSEVERRTDVKMLGFNHVFMCVHIHSSFVHVWTIGPALSLSLSLSLLLVLLLLLLVLLLLFLFLLLLVLVLVVVCCFVVLLFRCFVVSVVSAVSAVSAAAAGGSGGAVSVAVCCSCCCYGGGVFVDSSISNEFMCHCACSYCNPLRLPKPQLLPGGDALMKSVVHQSGKGSSAKSRDGMTCGKS